MAVAEGDPGREVCGLVVTWPGGASDVVPVRNAAGDAPADPGRTRRAFLLDPAEHLALQRRVRAGGGRIVAAFHSHVDGNAELSRHDRESLAQDGVPVLPGADQIVLGCAAGKVKEIKLFRWDGAAFAPVASLRIG